MEPDAPPPAPAPSLPRQIFNYLWRASWLKCPVCGTRPMFLPLVRVRSLDDWFTPLDGCPVCGYAYDREPGYFLIAHWGIVYGVSSLVGIGIYVWLQMFHSDWSFTKTLVTVAVPLPFVAFLLARHAKAYFLAVDHLCDPYIRPSDEEEGGDGDGGGGGGSKTRPVAPSSPDAPASPDPAGQPGSGIAWEREAEDRKEAEQHAGTR